MRKRNFSLVLLVLLAVGCNPAELVSGSGAQRLPPLPSPVPQDGAAKGAAGTASSEATAPALPSPPKSRNGRPLRAIKITNLPLEIRIGSRPISLKVNASTDINTTPTSEIAWQIDNPELARVENGQLIPLAAGRFRLTARSTETESLEDSVYLKVTDPRIPIPTPPPDLPPVANPIPPPAEPDPLEPKAVNGIPVPIPVFSFRPQFPTLSLSEIYERAPDLEGCDPGQLKATEKQKVLDALNYVRALHRLKPVAYNPADDEATAMSSLIMAANGFLTHFPPKSAKCWSAAGSAASGESNLSLGGSQLRSPGTRVLGYHSEWDIAGYLIDSQNVTENSIGHRRWLLNPFLKLTSFGRVDGQLEAEQGKVIIAGGALKIINDEQHDLTDSNLSFIAYPYEDYPSFLFEKDYFLSFSVLVDKKSLWRSQAVDFSQAVIAVAPEKGVALQVESISFDNLGIGLPNSIQWKAKKILNNVKYNVTISDVLVQGAQKTFAYSFRLKL